jgi:aldehyde dehydrogenase (NAD+)
VVLEDDLALEIQRLLTALGADHALSPDGSLVARSPISGLEVGRVRETGAAEADAAIRAGFAAHLTWRNVPAPRRGELVRLLGEELRIHKASLGRLVSIEVGKCLSEGLGEVQEMIDICDFAVGLSRQLYGFTIASERADHRMMETWHPLGVTGIISAFNFPVAVWSWNAALALVCGNAIVWKPSEKAPLAALATQAIFERAAGRFAQAGGTVPRSLSTLLIGGHQIGAALVDHPKVALVSATGSTPMGREVGTRVAARFGRAILELGGNNAAIVGPSADLDVTVRGVGFAAMGTAGQRCTSLRRLFVQSSIYEDFVSRLKRAYASVSVGNPLDGRNLIGPLIDSAARERMDHALAKAQACGGSITGGEHISVGTYPK